MRITLKVLLVLFFSMVTFVGGLTAQEKTKEYVKVTTFKKEEFFGYIRQNNKDKIVLETSSAVIEISKKKVQKIEYLKKKRKKNKVKNQSVDSDYDNIKTDFVESEKYTFDSKYAFGNTGYGLGKGQGYYHNYWIFYNDINYGVSDNFSIGAGLVPLFLFNGAPFPLWLKAKFSVPIKKDMINIAANVGAGTLLGSGWVKGGASIFAIGGVATFGPRHKNVSLGITYLGTGEGGGAIVNLGGKLKISRRSYLIAEVTLPNRQLGFVSLGGMTIFDTLALDYGLIVPNTGESEFFLAFPYLGVKIHFGQK